MNDRKAWMATLARANAAELQALIANIGELPPFRYTRQAEIGLCQIRGRIGGHGRAFNLGEMTVTRCAVVLDERIEGIAYVQGRDRQHAELAALADACLLDGLLSSTHLQHIHDRLQKQRRNRQSRSDDTRVEFFTLVRGENPQ